ncbi:MAG: endonuclease/exonuclease/phosphatase family protein, partial [Anaerolineales bacterium]|nr:endonuclease/exonuclease/phosphatase family protein [Anaerolineales bacterium]
MVVTEMIETKKYPSLIPSAILILTLLILAIYAYTSPRAQNTTSLSPILLDGHFEDWAARPHTLDSEGDTGKSGLDLLEIGLAHTDSHLYLHVKLNRPINLQSDRALYLTLNTDADPEPELFYDFGNRAGAFEGRPVTQFDLGLVTLPTHSSDEFEIALSRTLFPSDTLSLTLKDPAPTGGDTAPDQDAAPGALPYTFTASPEPDQPPLPLEKPAPASLRLVTWNMLRDGMFDQDRAPAFQRILTALQPDLIAFQEVYNRTAKSVQVKLEDWLGAPWYTVQVGDLVLASRTPFVEDWTDTYQPLTAARTFPVMVEINGTRLILFNAHLSCCDADAERQEQVDRVIAFLRDAQFPPNTPLIFVGDLNLVGDAAQLTTLLTGNIADETQFGPDHLPDWDATPLADLTPRQTHAPFAYTWRDDRDT